LSILNEISELSNNCRCSIIRPPDIRK